MKYEILNTIGKAFSLEAKEILNNIGKVDYKDLANQASFKKCIKKKPYNILLVGLGLNIDRDIIDAAKNLKIIATATTGLDHIDIEYAGKKGIKILSLRGERKFLDTITGTSELSFALALNLFRNILPAVDSAKNYCWTEKFRGHNLYGKTLGIVGLGRLGSLMAKYGKAFGMKVIAFDPYLEKSIFQKEGVRKASFKELLKSSDLISIHVHLSNETENMFNEKVFKLMKNSVCIINTARGKIVDESDLLKCLKNGKIKGYAADVLAGELEFNHKFSGNKLIEYSKKHSNVIITPHVGGVTYESREMTDIFIAKKIKKHAS